MFFSCKCLNWGRKRIKMYFNCEISRMGMEEMTFFLRANVWILSKRNETNRYVSQYYLNEKFYIVSSIRSGWWENSIYFVTIDTFVRRKTGVDHFVVVEMFASRENFVAKFALIRRYSGMFYLVVFQMF